MVRHAQPVREHSPGGIADPGLSDLGRWQAERLRAWLAHEPIDAIVSSPKRRALETIRPVADQLGLAIEVIDDLDEIDRFSATYFPTELLATEGGDYWEAAKRQAWDEIGWDPPDVFAARVAATVGELVANPRGSRVAVACHGGVVNFAVRGLFPPGAATRVTCDYASITRLELGLAADRLAIVSLNETGHFDADRDDLRSPFDDGTAPHLRY